ncbi:MAG: hypothetical protein ACFFA3_19160 [Promethearchaeota archaeon]
MIFQTFEGIISALPYIALAIGLMIGIPFIIWVIYKLLRTYDVIGGIQKVEERGDYKNLEWLRRQYYELGWSLQDIANDQGVSMVTVKRWIDKLKSTSTARAVQDQEKSPRKDEKNTCTFCGQVNNVEFRFCVFCGKPL